MSMNKMNYKKALKYNDYKKIYKQCSGPGGLKLAEYMAEKMSLESGKKVIDIGFNRGYQTCFLAKEYGVDIVAIDPWEDRETGKTHVDFLMENAKEFNVSDRILGVKSGVPDSLLPSNYFDYAYCTTTLEMIRGRSGVEAYISSLKEIKRILKKGGILGLGEPMHFDVAIPDDLAPYLKENMWDKCFATINETKQAVVEAGFSVIEADYCEDANKWWNEYSVYDPFSGNNPNDSDTIVIKNDKNRWLSFGYVIAAAN